MVDYLDDSELLRRFGVTNAELDKLEEDATNGIFHGEYGEPIVGDMMLHAGFTAETCNLPEIDRRAAELGMTREEFLVDLSRREDARKEAARRQAADEGRRRSA